MKKILVIFLLSAVTCCSQDNQSGSWSADHTELNASGVSIPAVLTTQQQKNLNILCRVWGFLKYFHPMVADGKVDADRGLFAILPATLRAPDDQSLGDTLFRWISELGNIPSGGITTSMNNIFIENEMLWLQKDSLVAGKLRLRLLTIFRNRHIGEGYYVKSVKMVGNPDFANELKYAGVKGEDDGMRMLALFRYWNTVEYFFPSKYLTADQWDGVLEKYIPLFAVARTDSQYRRECFRLTATIHDTHAGGIGYDSASKKYMGNYSLPVAVGEVEGDMTVLFLRSDSLRQASLLKPGDKIVSINGAGVKKMIDSVSPYVQASNTTALTYYAMNKLTRSYRPENDLAIQRGGNTIQVKVTYLKAPFPENYRRNYTSIYPMYQKMGDDIGYINLEKIKAASLPEIFKAFENTRGLVIDVRNYPSEFMPFALGKYLKPQPSPFARFTSTDLQLPGRFTMTEPIQNGEKNTDCYKGKIVILINEVSISQSEYTAMALKTAPNAVVMGSQTAGADGNVSQVYLPGGMSSMISGLGVYYPDKKVTQGIGIVPDIEVKPTVKGIAEGRDEVLEKALQYIRAK
ncbi:MAG: S41 family peptidase [Bacteroidota bacterium]